jgi:hypothetical protein
MRDAPPNEITGPTLVFDSARRGGGTFVCSRCRADFRTSDPVRAFAMFGAREHKCNSGPKMKSKLALAVQS